MEQEADELTKMAGAHSRPQFSVDEWVGKCTEIGNLLETIRKFQRQFPNRNVQDCWRSCSNFNHTGHTYCKCPLFFVSMVSSDSETAFETFWLFPEHYRFLYTLKPWIPAHLLRIVVWDVHQVTNHLRTVLLLSAPFVCSSSWFDLSWSIGTVTEFLIM